MSDITLVETRDIAFLVAALHDADEDDERIRGVVSDGETTSYAMVADDSHHVGAVTLRWTPDDSEILYIAVNDAVRGQGVGRLVLDQIASAARRRGCSSLLVGTSNASLGTIAFYQKCGFRLDSIRRDYFNYFHEPVYENGIQIRDMLMLRLDVLR